MFRDLGWNLSGIGYRVIWLQAKILLYCGLRLIDSVHHRVARGELPTVGWLGRCQANRFLGCLYGFPVSPIDEIRPHAPHDPKRHETIARTQSVGAVDALDRFVPLAR